VDEVVIPDLISTRRWHGPHRLSPNPLARTAGRDRKPGPPPHAVDALRING
jgi:hypothetical protein